jgi:hypothetical protein
MVTQRRGMQANSAGMAETSFWPRPGDEGDLFEKVLCADNP